MDVIYQASNEDFNVFETEVREINAERIQSILTSIFRTIIGTRHTTRKTLVTSIPPMPITMGVASPTIVPTAATAPDMPVTTMAQLRKLWLSQQFQTPQQS